MEEARVSQRLEEQRVRTAEQEPIYTSTSYSSLHKNQSLNGCQKRVYTLEELKAKGFKVVPWDGK